jgi:hypothetical protein
MISGGPLVPWRIHYFAFEAGHGFNLTPVMVLFTGLTIAFVPFALCFPRNALAGWTRWKRALGLAVVLAWLSFFVSSNTFVAFEHDAPSSFAFGSWTAITVLSVLVAMAVFWHTYRKSDGNDRARLKWAMLGMSFVLVATILAMLLVQLPFLLSKPLSGNGLTPLHWVLALAYGFFWPLALGYAILRQRVIDVQFAVSRTLVYGAVSTLALAFVGAVHWLLGRPIEQSHLAIGLDGLAAIGLGLVLHRPPMASICWWIACCSASTIKPNSGCVGSPPRSRLPPASAALPRRWWWSRCAT